ncbi:hypothetical protein TNCV_685431 [Trichonephila clavipes]|nr:hypothetical protein TNCV_685431 [Trichonephila clavipes]
MVLILGNYGFYRTTVIHYDILEPGLPQTMKTSVSVLVKLKNISRIHDVHLQRIPSHVSTGSRDCNTGPKAQYRYPVFLGS